jgi:hypothetical protein
LAPAYGALSAAVLGAAGAALSALVRRRPREHRAYRLLPIAAAVAVFAHGFALPQIEPPYPSNQVALAQMAMAQEVLESAPSLPGEAGLVQEVFRGMRPPYLVRGAAAEQWNVLSRRDCGGPWLEPPAGVQAGTILYCVSPTGDEGWMTAVGTGEDQFGEPSLIVLRGRARVARLEPTGAEKSAPTGSNPRAAEEGAASSP